jgi:hypothetical protein
MKVTVNGREVDASDLLSKAPKRKARPRADGPAASHRGFRVIGHPPGAMEEAREANAEAWRRWSAHSGEERAKALSLGKRPPHLWDEQRWRQSTKKEAVRAKPYELSAAADECKALAEKFGWTDVQIVSLQQGDAPEPGMF